MHNPVLRRMAHPFRPVLPAAAAAVWLVAGCMTQPSPPTPSAVPPTQVAAEADPWVADARRVATSVPPRLLAALKKEIDVAGPEGAIGACRDLAPALARAASAESGWAVRRVSLRERNPKATPDDWERGVLAEFDRLAAAQGTAAPLERAALVTAADGRRERRYMRALPTQELCLACHGARASLSPAVAERLRTLYPADRAVDYRVGEIRGAMTLRQPVP